MRTTKQHGLRFCKRIKKSDNINSNLIMQETFNKYYFS